MPSRVPLVISPAGARRFLLEAQELAGVPSGAAASAARTLQLIRRLEAVQLDPVAAVERNQHLVLAARLPGYDPAVLDRLLAEGNVFEYWANAACVIPIEHYPFFEGVRRRLVKRVRPELTRLRTTVRHVIRRLEKEGPLPSRAFVTDDRVYGWWDNTDPKTKVTSHVLNEMWFAGLVTVVRRKGTERYYDLPEKTIPTALFRQAREIDSAAADAELLNKYLRAYRIFEVGDVRFGWRRIPAPDRRRLIAALIDAGTVVPLEIEGVRRDYFILAADVRRLRQAERAARDTHADRTAIRFLPPLDNLLWRRERVADLFDFRYRWEVYVPAAKRRFGYYGMPILGGDRLIGRIDPRLDREHGRLVIRRLELEADVRPNRELRSSIRMALETFAAFHHAQTMTVERSNVRGL